MKSTGHHGPTKMEISPYAEYDVGRTPSVITLRFRRKCHVLGFESRHRHSVAMGKQATTGQIRANLADLQNIIAA